MLWNSRRFIAIAVNHVYLVFPPSVVKLGFHPKLRTKLKINNIWGGPKIGVPPNPFIDGIFPNKTIQRAGGPFSEPPHLLLRSQIPGGSPRPSCCLSASWKLRSAAPGDSDGAAPPPQPARCSSVTPEPGAVHHDLTATWMDLWRLWGKCWKMMITHRSSSGIKWIFPKLQTTPLWGSGCMNFGPWFWENQSS